MIKYKSTHKYKIISLLCIIVAFSLVFFGYLSALTSSYFSSLLMLTIGFFTLYLLFFVFPEEIKAYEDYIEFETKMRKTSFKYSEIKEVKAHYTTRTLVLTGGDKRKAAVYYSIKIKDRPMSLLLFGGGIKKNRELYEYLINKIRS